MHREHLEGRTDFLPSLLLQEVAGKPGIDLVEQAHVLANVLRNNPLLRGGVVGGTETKLGFGPFPTTGTELAERIEQSVVKGKGLHYVKIKPGYFSKEVEVESIGQLSIHDELALLHAVRHMTQGKLPTVWEKRWDELVGEIRNLGEKAKQMTSPLLQRSGVLTLAPATSEGGQIRKKDAISFAALVLFLVSCGVLPKGVPTIDATPGSPPEPKSSPALDSTRTARPTVPPVEVTSTAVVIESGYGGAVNDELLNKFKERKQTKDLERGYREYIKYWESVKYFGSGGGKRVTFLPMFDPEFPNDPEKAILAMELSGDASFNGFVFTIPAAQMARYLVSGNPDDLTPPQGATTLQEGTDAFKMTKQVGKDSIPFQRGIPEGAVLEYWNGQFVYVLGRGVDAKVVGRLDQNYQWEAVREVNMTFEQWKNVLSGPYEGGPYDQNGKGTIYPDRWIFFGDEYSTLYMDASKIRALPNGTPFLVFSGNGQVLATRNFDTAANMVDSGAFAVVSKTQSMELQIRAALGGLNAAHLSGDGEFSVVIDGSVPSSLGSGVGLNFDKEILLDMRSDGSMYAPLFQKPPIFSVFGEKNGNLVLLDPPEGLTDENWIEQVLSMEFDGEILGIMIYP